MDILKKYKQKLIEKVWDITTITFFLSIFIYGAGSLDPNSLLENNNMKLSAVLGRFLILASGMTNWGRYFLPVVIISGALLLIMFVYKVLVYPMETKNEVIATIKENINVIIIALIFLLFFLII